MEGEEPKGFPYVLEDFHLAKRIGDAHETEVNCVAWNPRFPLLVSCDDEGCIKLWSFEHG